MLSSYVQLTGKYLKANKKRSLLTVIGIILSVALICTIGLFVNGVQKMQIESMKSTYGSWHIAYSNADDSLVSKVINNPKVSRYGFYSEGKEENLGGKIKVKQITATDKALELLPYKVEKGRLPKNESEAVMEKWSLSKIDSKANIGSKIKFDNKEYELVGIFEDNTQNQIDDKAVVLCKSNSIDKKSSVLLAEISSKTKIKAAVDELSKLGKSGKYQLNEYVLTMEGAGNNDSMNSGIYTVIFIIIGIVVISTIAVIYNSFQISVVERIKQFGLLRAVGATPKQIRKIAKRVIEGEYDISISENKEGDFSKLAVSFNSMRDTIRNNLNELRKEKQFLVELMTDISHQLKTPISSMTVYNDIMLEKKISKEQREAFLLKNQNQLNRMTWLIKSLLKLAKLDAKAIEFNKENQSLNETMQDSIDAMESKAMEKNIKIILHEKEQIVFSHDMLWLQEAFINIIKNCIEHTPSGGKINIELTVNPVYRRIIIEDTGEGISEEDLPHIFKRFYKAKNSNSDSVGIGLSLAKSIVESHGGFVEAESHKGMGTKFIITFLRCYL